MLPEAANASERFLHMVAHPKLFLRTASVCAQMKQWDRVIDILARGLEMFPNSAELLRARAEVDAMKASPEGAQAASVR